MEARHTAPGEGESPPGCRRRDGSYAHRTSVRPGRCCNWRLRPEPTCATGQPGQVRFAPTRSRYSYRADEGSRPGLQDLNCLWEAILGFRKILAQKAADRLEIARRPVRFPGRREQRHYVTREGQACLAGLALQADRKSTRLNSS